MQAFIVPYQISTALPNLSSQPWTELNQLIHNLSDEDVAYYLAINRRIAEYVSGDVYRSFEWVDFSHQLAQITPDRQRRIMDFYNQRLAERDVDLPSPEYQLVSDIHNRNMIRFSYIRADFIEDPEYQKDPALYITSRLVEQMNTLNDNAADMPHCKTPIYRSYLASLQKSSVFVAE